MESEDLFSSSKEKIVHFRLKELKEVLHMLGLSKQGKKQELTDRILASLCNEQNIGPRSNGLTRGNIPKKETIISIIDETYRKMQKIETSTSEISPKNSQNGFKKAKKEKKEKKEKEYSSSSIETKVQCPCGTSLFTDSMIKCEDPDCNIWQHISCVIIPESLSEGAPLVIPSVFYCELCRIKRADPFWVPVTNPLLPMILPPSITAQDGTPILQCIQKSFQLSKTNREVLQKPEFDLQVWCMLFNDKVPFRMQWPLNSDLQVNGIPMRIMSRPNTTQLGNNGRDDGPLITTCSREGMNKITLSKGDARTFCLGIRVVRRRSLQEVMSMIPLEEYGENYEDALARVRRCIGGGGGSTDENADVSDSDSDIELVSDSFTVNLCCPMSGSRMKIAGRFKPCVHMGCFDLETFVQLNQRSRKWQCPNCLKNYSLESLIIDPYFNRITSLMRNCGEDINEIEIKPDGSWRIKTTPNFNNNKFRDLASWHLPGGDLSVAPEVKVNPNFDPQIKTESIPMEIEFETKPQNIPNSDNFDQIVNATNNNNNNNNNNDDDNNNGEYNDVIVLSDSDDDEVAVLSPSEMVRGGPSVYNTENISCLDLLNTDRGEFDDLSFWDYQTPAGAHLFDNGAQTGGPVAQHNFMHNNNNNNNNNNNVGPLLDTDAASILRSLNENHSNPKRSQSQSQAQSQRGFSTFSPPRQPRSVRQRIVLSIDSDSE